ncbi:MAG: acetyl-CoA carboxylase biotin carboxyl carrier protein [Candidatus Hatepunaea meridiana]|nr:acetyl-CoA carboxylase biotin carboxyl carrier protein [Candidatus Hatepunaea meridiana]
MKITEIRRLIKLVESSGINELEIEEEGSRVRIVKQISGDGLVPTYITTAPSQSEQVPSSVQSGSTAIETPVVAPEPSPPITDNLVKITSPMVGTFYRAPSPEAPSYVQIGDKVKPGQVLCIIEAMKLMNEIEAEVSGEIVEITTENAQPIEFGQVIFVIDSGM